MMFQACSKILKWCRKIFLNYRNWITLMLCDQYWLFLSVGSTIHSYTDFAATVSCRFYNLHSSTITICDIFWFLRSTVICTECLEILVINEYFHHYEISYALCNIIVTVISCWKKRLKYTKLQFYVSSSMGVKLGLSPWGKNKDWGCLRGVLRRIY
jgi:hypothetical protein